MFIAYAALFYGTAILLALGFVVCSSGMQQPKAKGKGNRGGSASGDDDVASSVGGDLPDIVAPRRRYAAPPSGLARSL